MTVQQLIDELSVPSISPDAIVMVWTAGSSKQVPAATVDLGFLLIRGYDGFVSGRELIPAVFVNPEE